MGTLRENHDREIFTHSLGFGGWLFAYSPPPHPISNLSQSTNSCSERAVNALVSKKCAPSMELMAATIKA
jgi:hypothetical protein